MRDVFVKFGEDGKIESQVDLAPVDPFSIWMPCFHDPPACDRKEGWIDEYIFRTCESYLEHALRIPKCYLGDKIVQPCEAVEWFEKLTGYSLVRTEGSGKASHLPINYHDVQCALRTGASAYVMEVYCDEQVQKMICFGCGKSPLDWRDYADNLWFWERIKGKRQGRGWSYDSFLFCCKSCLTKERKLWLSQLEEERVKRDAEERRLERLRMLLSKVKKPLKENNLEALRSLRKAFLQEETLPE